MSLTMDSFSLPSLSSTSACATDGCSQKKKIRVANSAHSSRVSVHQRAREGGKERGREGERKKGREGVRAR